MAIDPRQLRPSQLVQLLNSTSLGTVVGERQLHRHRSRAGLRIGDGRRVDLLKYLAWLRIEIDDRRQASRAIASVPRLTGYEAHRERSRQRVVELSLSGRDIGELPPVYNQQRRDQAERDFRFFCETYFPQTFHLEWSDDHLKVIRKIEVSVLEGGLFAMAMPRGSGKTSLCETACLWALLYGHREFVALIGADKLAATKMLEAMVTELEHNERLEEDFPEVCYPIRRLDGIRQRAVGQLHQGRSTLISITAGELVLPTIDGSRASGCTAQVAGLTGRVRGMKHKRPDGTSIRPSLVLVDDPQTEESAWSPLQCRQRERIVAGAVLGLGGPETNISGLMTLTIVRPDDMAERLLDREKHPQWHGERTKMVYAFPTNEDLWAQYRELRTQALVHDLAPTEANEFYAANRAAMDEGAVVAWPARKNATELSAIQHAMNLRLDRGDHAFFAEYQNEPLSEIVEEDDALSADAIAAKTNGLRRGLVPAAATAMTMFIDVQGKALYWLVVAWEDDFTGYVVDYGTEPDQHSEDFSLRELKHTLQMVTPTAGLEGAIYAGLERLCEATVGREWPCADGAGMRMDRCLIDANWGTSTDVVKQFCRQSRFSGVIMPAHGRYVGASSVPFGEYRRKKGDRAGINWRVPALDGRQQVRHVLFDTNYWKTFVHARLAVDMGDPGCLSLFGERVVAPGGDSGRAGREGASVGSPAGSPRRDSRGAARRTSHRLLSEHLVAEYRVRTEGRGRRVDEWKLHPGRDNHWLDCLAGAAVAAAMVGPAIREVGDGQRTRKRNYVSFAQMQRDAQARQAERGREMMR